MTVSCGKLLAGEDCRCAPDRRCCPIREADLFAYYNVPYVSDDGTPSI
jgi:hypothetical protein